MWQYSHSTCVVPNTLTTIFIIIPLSCQDTSSYGVHCVRLIYSSRSSGCIWRNWATPVLRNGTKCFFVASKQVGSWLIMDLRYGAIWSRGSWSSLVQVKASPTARGYYMDHHRLITKHFTEKYFQQIWSNYKCSFNKMHLNSSSAIRGPFCASLRALSPSNCGRRLIIQCTGIERYVWLRSL